MVERITALLTQIAAVLSGAFALLSRRPKRATPCDSPTMDRTTARWIRGSPRGSLVDCLPSAQVSNLEENSDVRAAIGHQLRGANDAAITNLRVALQSDDLSEHQSSVVHTLLGQSLMQQGAFSESLDEFEIARTLAAHSSSAGARACALLGLGELEGRIGLLDKAIDHLNNAQSSFQQARSAVGLSRVSCELARLFHMKGDFQKAHSYATQAKRLAEAAASKRLQGDAQHIQGCIYRDEGDPSRALAHLRKAADWHSELDAKLAYADDVRNIGFCHLHSGDLAAGEQDLEESLSIYQTHGDKWGEALSQISLATIQSRRGNFDVALQRNDLARHLSRDVGNLWGEAHATGNMGAIHLQLGNLGTAEQLLREGLVLHHRITDDWGIVRAQSNLAVIEMTRGDYTESLDSFKMVRAAFRKIGARKGEAGALINMGLVKLETEDYRLARVYLENALAICRSTGDRLSEAIAMNNLGETAFECGEISTSSKLFLEAIRLFDSMGCAPYSVEATSNLAMAHLQERKLDRGETLHAEALKGLLDAENTVCYADAVAKYALYHPALSVTQKRPLFEEAVRIYDEKGVASRWERRIKAALASNTNAPSVVS